MRVYYWGRRGTCHYTGNRPTIHWDDGGVWSHNGDHWFVVTSPC